MFDLKFSSSVLDEMPVGTSYRDSDHEITKKDEGWECDDCSSPTTYDSSAFYMSDPSQEYALNKFAGAVIDPNNLDPRLLAFLPTGTKVADIDTLSSNNWYWYKTKTGLWVWDESQEGAETAASNGVGVENLGTLVHLRPFRLHSVGTNEAPEPETEEIPEGKTDFTASEATNFKDRRFRDRHEDVWLFDEETDRWRFIRSDGTLSCLFRYEKLDSFLEPYILVEGEMEAKAEPEADPAEELSAEQANEKRDFVLKDTDDDKWTYSDGQWHCEGYEHLTGTNLPDMFEPYEVVEPLASPEPEAEPAKTMLSAKEASEHKDTVFEDCDGDAWFFDDVLQRWRGIGPDWAYAKEELEPLFSPFNEVGPLSEFERLLTAEEANRLKDEALEDRDGDTWIYDVPSEKWKCGSAAITNSELDAYYQPYRIKRAASRTAAPEAIILGDYDPLKAAGDTEEPSPEAEASEEVTFEGSAKEAVQLLDRIARSLESISNKLGDK